MGQHSTTFMSGTGEYCRTGTDHELTNVMRKLSGGVPALINLGSILDSSQACCATRRLGLDMWRKSVEERIRAIPEFRTFLPSIR